MKFPRRTKVLATRPDVIHILTPPSSHCPLALEALRLGCHVFVEKPMAETLEECDLMIALARVRFGSDRVDEGLALVEQAMPIAEREELQEALFDGLIIKGSLLSKAKRPVEGLALVDAARRLAVEVGATGWEARALIPLSLSLAIRDPRAALELEREAIALARRIGRRDMELLLIGNASEDAIRTGDWDFPATEFASLSGLDIAEDIRLPMENALMVIEMLRGAADGIATLERFEQNLIISEDLDVASAGHDARAWVAFADGRFDDASAGWLAMAEMSALNAPYVLPRAGHSALLARDAASAQSALDQLIATGAHGRALEMDRTALRAGLAALDGRMAEAVIGFRSALTGSRDMGLAWDECLTAMSFVRVVGVDDPDARAAGEAAQVILRRLGAVRVLAMLDPWMTGSTVDDVVGESRMARSTSDTRQVETA